MASDAVADLAVEPEDWDVAACDASASIVALAGDPGDLIHPGVEIIRGQWDSSESSISVASVFVPRDATHSAWRFVFSGGSVLRTGLYDGVTAWPASRTRPGMSVAGNGTSCDTLSGGFRVYEFELGDAGVQRLTIAFVQHCDGRPPALRGCIHIE